jgi:MFS transporter, DHA2 family, multidrug resistance protein
MTSLRSNKWLTLGVLCLTVLVIMIDNTIVNVALPTISRALGAGTSGLQWVVDAYTLVFAGLLLGAGHAGDRFGRKRVLLIGIVGFGAMSAAAALVTSLNALITARACLGLFAALIFPATLAMVMTTFQGTSASAGRQRAVAVGIWAAMAGVGVAIGPVAGGLLLEHHSWASVFWVNVPYSVIVLGVVAVALPESLGQPEGGFDFAGLALSIGGIGVLVWTIIEAPHHGWKSAATLIGFACAAVLLAAFIGWERRVQAPLLDVTLFANRRFTVSVVVISVAFFSLFGFIFLVTQYFQVLREYGTLSAGLHTLPFAIVMAMFSPIAMVCAKLLPGQWVIAAGLTAMGAGFYMVTRMGLDTSYWRVVIVSMSLMAAGLAFVQGPATEILMNTLPLKKAGSGSAVNDTSREIGGTLGVAVLGSIMATSFATKCTLVLTPLPIPDPAKAAASTSFVAGADIARRLPADVGTHMLLLIKASFGLAMQDATWVAVSACWVGALIALIGLRAKSRGTEHGAEPLNTVPAAEMANVRRGPGNGRQ